MSVIDLSVIVVYLIASVAIGLALSGRQRNAKDYLQGGGTLPWWAVCLSVVATETSALTVISTPSVAYLGDLTFIQVTVGYLIGRTVVAFLLLPRYRDGEMVTAYQYLGRRFGRGMQSGASVVFLVTRLLADGVRLFAAAIPIKVMLAAYDVDVSYFVIIAALGIVTIAYTFFGGLRAVVWVDVFQMALYVIGGVIALFLILNALGDVGLAPAVEAGKIRFLDFTSNPISAPYAFLTAVVGGAVMAMGSHGIDQIIVQRLVATRTLRDSQLALIGSGIVVIFQFGLFLVVGLGLWVLWKGRSPEEMGMGAPDELFPTFIVNDMPAGLSGLLLAGIMASAMSTLSSSLSALTSSTMTDIIGRFRSTPLEDAQALWCSRVVTVIWGVVFVGAGALFRGTDNPVMVLGLSIAAITYGGLLGSFLLGLWVRKARQADAMISLVVTLAVMTTLFVAAPTLIGFTWYTLIGAVIMLVVGGALSLRHSGEDPQIARGA